MENYNAGALLPHFGFLTSGAVQSKIGARFGLLAQWLQLFLFSVSLSGTFLIMVILLTNTIVLYQKYAVLISLGTTFPYLLEKEHPVLFLAPPTFN